jgi:hypothetical protein
MCDRMMAEVTIRMYSERFYPKAHFGDFWREKNIRTFSPAITHQHLYHDIYLAIH